MIRKGMVAALCCALLLSFSACGTQPESAPLPPSAPESSGQSSSSVAFFAEPDPAALPDPADELPSTGDYIRQVIREHTAKIEQPGMSEYERVKAAADYVMSIGYYHRPVALDVWRWRTAGDRVPTYEQMRGLHMLLFGIETCEGYAAALNLLLEEMGIETRYMTGMTYLARGGLGYHSWSQVKIDGVWYHLDCELEDGIARDDGHVSYRYFLKSDASMSASHFWGQRLIDLGRLEPGQVEEVQVHYMGESCPQDYPTPAPNSIPVNPRPDTDSLREELSAELAEYEASYGSLDYMELDILPPVFVRYYYRDGEPPEDAAENIRDYRQVRLLIDPPGSASPSIDA
ncbi:MAG: hypothetical protein HFG27_12970 [Provencibacterium sp.]|jgi:hypothetical protein|nr:hypothetical protein [Provencibacterium sp.]